MTREAAIKAWVTRRRNAKARNSRQGTHASKKVAKASHKILRERALKAWDTRRKNALVLAESPKQGGVPMTDRDVMQIIEREFRRLGLRPFLPNSREATALLRAAREIASEADANQRSAARSASIVGYAVTRGKTTL